MENTLELNDKMSFTRILFFIIGLSIMGLGIGLIVVSNFGAGPWDAVTVGLSHKLSISMGLAMNMIAFTQIIIGGIINKEFPKLTTMITSIFLGIFIDFWMLFLNGIVTSTLFMKFSIFVVGVVVVSIGISLYLVTKLPNTPLDYFMMAIKNKLNLSLMTAKITSESIGLVLGLILGGTIGLGTLIILLAIGPILQMLQKPCNNLYTKLS